MIRRVLLVEDEESLVLTVRDRLLNEGAEDHQWCAPPGLMQWGPSAS